MTDDKIKLGVLWKNLSREGNKPYLSGRVQQDNVDAAAALAAVQKEKDPSARVAGLDLVGTVWAPILAPTSRTMAPRWIKWVKICTSPSLNSP